jgi:hypothetical protein
MRGYWVRELLHVPPGTEGASEHFPSVGAGVDIGETEADVVVVVVVLGTRVVTGRTTGFCVSRGTNAVWLMAYMVLSAYAIVVKSPRQKISTIKKVLTLRRRYMHVFYRSNIKMIWFVQLTKDTGFNRSENKKLMLCYSKPFCGFLFFFPL